MPKNPPPLEVAVTRHGGSSSYQVSDPLAMSFHPRRRVLYAPLNAARFACRRCHRLRDGSQREREADRLLRRARKRWRRAGSTDDREPWQKPKWMRWNTFSRLVLEGWEAQEQGDWLILQGFSAGLASIINKRRRG
jgi:hypothetical protein